ncbi:MAG: alpha/beta hydrolase [Proteobacteria bacterium]|nr:alpha/beta hydrolase [Pseudomonadota bacterium]
MTTFRSQNSSLTDDLGTLHYSWMDHPDHLRTITFICGYSRSHKDFRLWQKKLAMTGYNVLLFDNRGSGLSKANQPFGFEQHTKDILCLWKHLGITHSAVIGFSMGGLIAQCLASHLHNISTRHISQLVLISTLPSSGYFSPLTGKTFHNPYAPLWHHLEKYFSQRFLKKHPHATQTLHKEVKRLSASTEDSQQLTYQRSAFQQASYKSIHHNHIAMPTLIIHGEDDRIIYPQAADTLHRLIPHTTLILYPQCGHLLLAEQPAKLYADISQFLNSHN